MSVLTTMVAATRRLLVPINLELSSVHATIITSATDSTASVSDLRSVFSERELTFTFAVLSSVRLSVVCLSSGTFVHPTQAIEHFGNVSTPSGSLAIH